MYTKPNIFHRFCSAIESGSLKGTSAQKCGPPSTYLTVAAEAHFRVELWFSLAQFGYNHPTSADHGRYREEQWQAMMELVYQDRKNNMNMAWETRKTMLEGGDEVQEDSQSGEENAVSEEEGTVDKKFW
jgi:hypothetical protein